jgi:hypothetical protein
MRRPRSIAPVLLAWASIASACNLVVPPRIAKACGATPCVRLDAVFPRDGATHVATNTELRAQYFGTFQANACTTSVLRMRLVPDGAAVVGLQPSLQIDNTALAWLVAEPSSPLQPSTHYALQGYRLATDGTCSCDGTPDWMTVSEFTTGTSTDTQQPVFAGAQALEATQAMRSSNDCGMTFGFNVKPAVTPGSDDSGDLSYQLYVNGELARRYVGDPEQALFVTCDGNTPFGAGLLRPMDLIELRAVDVAGNLSEAHTPVQVPAGCPLPGSTSRSDRDAGPGAPSQSEAGAAGSSSATALDAGKTTQTSAHPQSASCSTAGPGSSPGARFASWSLLLLLLPWIRARRFRMQLPAIRSVLCACFLVACLVACKNSSAVGPWYGGGSQPDASAAHNSQTRTCAPLDTVCESDGGGSNLGCDIRVRNSGWAIDPLTRCVRGPYLYAYPACNGYDIVGQMHVDTGDLYYYDVVSHQLIGIRAYGLGRWSCAGALDPVDDPDMKGCVQAPSCDDSSDAGT